MPGKSIVLGRIQRSPAQDSATSWNLTKALNPPPANPDGTPTTASGGGTGNSGSGKSG